MTTYRVTHRTEYEYEGEVAASHSRLHLLPRDGEGQTCVSTEIDSAPLAGDYAEHADFFGNRVGYLAIHEPHRALHITATSIVEVDDRDREPSLFGDVPWEEVRDAVWSDARADAVDAMPFALDSPLVAASPELAAYAAPSFPAGRHLLDAVTDLAARIHADFIYEPGATEVATPLAEVLEGRKGVCQDFAHVGIGCLRSLGLPARYVSGYLETDPPPGRPKLVGADVSHAWFSVLVPEAGWLDLDPTNDQLVNHRYVVTAFGRDYRDVPPVSGVIYTEGGTTSLRVQVDVAVV
jgi:transglutaminase-like putative cysteine protease